MAVTLNGAAIYIKLNYQKNLNIKKGEILCLKALRQR